MFETFSIQWLFSTVKQISAQRFSEHCELKDSMYLYVSLSADQGF